MRFKADFSLDEVTVTAGNLLMAFPGRRIFAFSGNLGAGKTTFIKAACRVLGSKDTVTSPTFALVNEYLAEERQPVFHFDFYRIKSITEVFDIGYEDYFFSGNYCFIEWPEQVVPLLPPETVMVKITVAREGLRHIDADLTLPSE